MGDTHVRKSLIPDEKPASSTAQASGKSKSKAKAGADADDSTGNGKVRVIAITSVFVLLLAFVAYKYWSDSEPKYIPPEVETQVEEPAKPGQPRIDAPVPPEMKPDRRDVIQG